MKKLFAILMLTVCGYPVAAPAAAQDGVMLKRGVYTNADISRRCQDYVNRRMSDTTVDRSRQSVFIACVRRLSRNENAGNVAGDPTPYGAPPPPLNEAPVALQEYGAPPPPMIEAPVALPAFREPGSGYGTCRTDEGYGRTGSCDNF